MEIFQHGGDLGFDLNTTAGEGYPLPSSVWSLPAPYIILLLSKEHRCWNLHYWLVCMACVIHISVFFFSRAVEGIDVMGVSAAVVWLILTGHSWAHTFMAGRNNMSWNHLHDLSSSVCVCVISTKGGSCCVMYKVVKITAVFKKKKKLLLVFSWKIILSLLFESKDRTLICSSEILGQFYTASAVQTLP